MCRNNYMKDKTLPYLLTISPTICHIKIFILTFFSYFKKFHPSALQKNYTFIVQTMAFQAKLLSYYVFTAWFIQHGCETFQNVN